MAKAGTASSRTIAFDLARLPRLREVLAALCYDVADPPPHACLRVKGDGFSLTLYNSGKLLLQGKRSAGVYDELLAFGLFGQVDNEDTVGSDESGKGDVFGPLVVAAVFVDQATGPELQRIGVADSKKLGAQAIETLARQVRSACEHEVVAISPPRYNELYERFRNLNRMLAWAHARAIEKVVERCGCTHVVVDQFARDKRVVTSALGPLANRLTVVQRPRAEEVLAVAAASVLARSRFVNDLRRLGEAEGCTLPLGASSHVARKVQELFAAHGREVLQRVSKMHFSTVQRVVGP